MSMVAEPILVTSASPPPVCPAKGLDPCQRQELAVAALAGVQTITVLAAEHQVSRKFVYQMADQADEALRLAFATPPPASDQAVLFYLPVTKAWLQQLILALVLVCHCSYRGVVELLRDLFDYPLSVGSIHRVVQQGMAKATALNARQDLANVGIAALDELFQTGDPVLTVVDVASTYCCLLSLEEHRDADTWGIRLLDLQQQGFAPRATVGDGGTGMRAGQRLALPDIPCRADHFHAAQDLSHTVRFLDNQAYRATAALDKLQRLAQGGRRSGQPAEAGERARQQDEARGKADSAVALADDVAALARWLRQDVLAVAGPPLAVREELFDFIVAQLKQRQGQCPHRLGPLVKQLQGQKQELLAFAEELDQSISTLAAVLQVPAAVVREMVAVEDLPSVSPERWRRAEQLHQVLRGRYEEVRRRVTHLRAAVVRASSVVENVNSRLRNYFFLRREVGGGYLELLRFFLNHRRFLRSEHAERVGRSPAELLSGQEHAHWLELLGFQRFRRAA